MARQMDSSIKRLFVTPIRPDVDHRTIKNHFAIFGRAVEATNRKDYTAFVYCSSLDEANKITTKTDGTLFMGRRLKVELARVQGKDSEGFIETEKLGSSSTSEVRGAAAGIVLLELEDRAADPRPARHLQLPVQLEVVRPVLLQRPGRIHLLRYEYLSVDPEPVTRALLEFLDLPWAPAVGAFLESHTTEDKVYVHKAAASIQRRRNQYGTGKNSKATVIAWKKEFGWNKLSL